MQGGGGLLERDGEVRRCLELVARVRRGEPDAVVLEAAAGVGKSSLLGLLAATANDADVDVLRATGTRLESEMPFGAVRQLFSPTVQRLPQPVRDDLWRGAAEVAAGVVGDVPVATPTDLSALVHGLYWMTVRLTERGPLVLVVDDAQWCDEESLRFLSYLLQRIEGVAVGVALGVRAGEAAATGPTMAEIRAATAVDVLRPLELSPAAVQCKVAELTGGTSTEAFALACHAVTNGNPFLLEELVQTCLEEGIGCTDEGAAQVAGAVVRDVADAVLLRLARQSTDAVELARSVAVLGPAATVQRAARLAGLDVATASRQIEALTTAHVLAADPPLRFRHPLVQSSIYGDLPATSRAARHGQAVDVLLEERAADETVAPHLLLAEPAGDLQRRDVLHRAGAGAAARGAHRTAVHLLRRALDEAPAVAAPDIWRALGRAEATFDAAAGAKALETARELAVDDRMRVDVTSDLAEVLVLSADPLRAVELLTELVESNPLADDPAATARIVAQWGIAALTVGPQGTLVYHRLSAVVGATRDGSVERALAAAALALSAESITERRTWALAAASGAAHLVESGLLVSTVPRLVVMMCTAGQLDIAREVALRAATAARASGSSLAVAVADYCIAITSFHAGRLADAEAEVASSLELAREGGWAVGVSMCSALLAMVWAERERPAEALALLDQAPSGPGVVAAELQISRMRALLAAGRYDEAIAISAELDALLGPLGMVGHQTPRVHALVGLGRWEEARGLAAKVVAAAQKSQVSFGVTVALIAQAATRPDDVEAWQALVDETSTGPFPFQALRALVGLGEALRRARRPGEARRVLEQALDAAARCSATSMEQHIRAELASVGARPRRTAVTGVAALTPAELRTCRLAAERMTNEQIAQTLFVSVKTVETQLSVAYRKLGISGRAALGRALAEHAG